MNTLKEMFDFFDRNSDGLISRVELIELVGVLLNEKGIGKSSKILKEFDANHDGYIDFEEFSELARIKLNI
jgi:calcium-binding protein CML